MVYIKTNLEEIPQNCVKCPYGKKYGAVGDVHCRILNDYFTNNPKPPYKDRPDECPMICVDTAFKKLMDENKPNLEDSSDVYAQGYHDALVDAQKALGIECDEPLFD